MIVQIDWIAAILEKELKRKSKAMKKTQIAYNTCMNRSQTEENKSK